MYPKWTFPENSRKVPKRRKNSTGPARSESSMMCWSIRASGLRTANVYSSTSQLQFCWKVKHGSAYLALNMRKVYSKLL